MATRRSTTAPPTQPSTASVLAHREYRYWRLLRSAPADHGDDAGARTPDDVLGHVGHLDEVQALIGVSLVETGGHGAALAPGTLPPDLHAEVPAARRENEALTAALDQARRRWRHLAATLRGEGLTATQTAKALGISRAAVDKLVTRAAADPPGPDTSTPTTDPTALADARHLRPQDTRDVTARVEEVRREVEQATAHQEKFSARWRRLAVALQDAGLTNRDVAHLLGVTEPRVTQLAPRDGRRIVSNLTAQTS